MVWEPLWESISITAPLRNWTSCSVTCDIIQGVQSQEDRDIDNTKTIRKIKALQNTTGKSANRYHIVKFLYKLINISVSVI